MSIHDSSTGLLSGMASMRRALSLRRTLSATADPVHRVVVVGDDEENKTKLQKEPHRAGPPHTGPGVQTNEVITSVYTLYSFLPLNLRRQMSRAANIYFLCISILQCIKAVSITSGVPTTALPLAFVLFVTAVKDAIEDFNRHRADATENNRLGHVLIKEKHFDLNHAHPTKWCDIKVGDVVVIKNRELIPSDIVLLASSEPSGLAFVMTANLDGETNLKAKEVHQGLRQLPLPAKLAGATVVCDLPNNNLEHFEGLYTLGPEVGERKVPLTQRNILLRGCMLRNTTWAVGVVVYTGKETKIQMNAAETAQKIGSVRRFVDRETVMVFGLQVLCCLCAAVVGGIYVGRGGQMPYLWVGAGLPDPALSGFIQFWTYTVLFSNMLPISLLVTLDMVKFLQGMWMSWDLSMYHETRDSDGKLVEIPCVVRSSDLNEELGVIEHVFSDKTGTLTCNIMEFSKCSIGGVSYGLGLTQIGRAFRERNGMEIIEPPPRDPEEPVTPFVNIIDPALVAVMKDETHPNHKKCRDFWLALALNHDVMPEGPKDRLVYSGSSPDETALVYAAKHHGFFFTAREPGKVTVEIKGKPVDFNVLHVLEFTSDRKKSSVVLRREDGSIVLFCKGADNVIKSRLSSTLNSPTEMAGIDADIAQYVNDGLRTLLLAKAELTAKQYEDWAKRYHEAETSIKNRDEKRHALMEELERELEMMGITAIEDKLQEGVPETIAALRQAGIKVWVLTGDKVDTAINIGHSCQLLSTEMKILRLCGEDGKMALDNQKVPLKEPIQEEMRTMVEAEMKTAAAFAAAAAAGDGKEGKGGTLPPRALIVDTYALAAILKYELEDLMLPLCHLCVSVVCARVSPRQKAMVVEMVKKADPSVQTLSIGDGANDVPMLQAAHVGVGIFGLEGQQAVNNSDYAIGQFRFLGDLLLVHGRFNYRRIATVVKYIFYKSAVLVLPQFFFGIESLFSGQPIYQDIIYQLANVLFTAFPIIAFGVFDRDVPVKQALASPGLYKDGIERKFLNRTVFWAWMLEAILHALLIIFLPMLALGYFNVLPTAESVSIWELGTIVFLSFLTVVSLRLAVEVLEWHVLIAVLIIVSLLFWWLAWAVLNFMLALAPTIYGSFLVFPDSSRFWFVYLSATMACFVTMFAVEGVSVLWYPLRSQLIRERLAGFGVEEAGGADKGGHGAGAGSSSTSNGNGYASAVVVPMEQEQEEGRVGLTKAAE